jgi:hypothetical protein
MTMGVVGARAFNMVKDYLRYGNVVKEFLE